MQKVQSVPSCLAYSTDSKAEESVQASEDVTLLNEGYDQICRSAATIGLVITMGATGMLLFNQEAAIAVESIPAESTVTSLPAPKIEASSLSQQKIAKPSPVSYVKLAPLAVKHQVKQGESLWELSKEYQIAPAAIAASNKLSPQANLSIGQTLKIPSLKETGDLASNRPTPKIAYQAIGDESEQLNTSLKNLRETRKRLQENLAQLKFQETQIINSSDFAIASSQVSQRVKSERILTIAENSTLIPQISALVPQKDRAPASDPLPVPVSAIVNPKTPKLQENEEFQPLNDSSAAFPVETTSSNRDRPIAIPSSPIETATVPSRELKQPELVFPEVKSLSTENAESTTRPAYQVTSGDSLNQIARKHGVSVAALIRANQITNPNLIKVAQQLIIPQTDATQKVNSDSSASLNHAIPKSSVSVVTASLAPVPLETAQTQTNELSQSLNEANRSDKTLEISVEESSTLAHTEKLMADIERLQQEYSNESRPVSIVELPKTNDNNRSNARTINPEWVRNRQLSPERSPIETQNPSPLPISRSSQNSQPKAQLVGAAPSNTGQYNNMIRVPVGETVGPELPPLSSPDDYLPDTPMKFTGYIWPARGVLTSGYGWRWGRMHKGVDIAAPIGTPVMAAAAGEVVSAGWNSGGYGNLVKVKHADGSLTLYGHNSKILVHSGQVVEQGEQIAEMGSTGYSTGPHLHFEIHPNGQNAVNPMAYLPKQRS